MSDRVYIDTSFFIATQIIEHPFHKQAISYLENSSTHHFFFSLLTIDEIIHTLLFYKIPKKQIDTIIREKIIDMDHVHLVSYPTDISSIHQYITIWTTTGLKPRDALHLYLMKTHTINNIATFEEDFKQISSREHILIMP